MLSRWIRAAPFRTGVFQGRRLTEQGQRRIHYTFKTGACDTHSSVKRSSLEYPWEKTRHSRPSYSPLSNGWPIRNTARTDISAGSCSGRPRSTLPVQQGFHRTSYRRANRLPSHEATMNVESELASRAEYAKQNPPHPT